MQCSPGAGERSSGWKAGGQPAIWDGAATRGHGVGGGRAEAGAEAGANSTFSSKAGESVKKVSTPGEVAVEIVFKRAADT